MKQQIPKIFEHPPGDTSQGEFNFDTQTQDKYDHSLLNTKFKPFSTERNSVGKLINPSVSDQITRTQTIYSDMKNQSKQSLSFKGFTFLKGQEKLSKGKRFNKTTTNLLGLQTIKINNQFLNKFHFTQSIPISQQQFKHNMNAEQNFIQNFSSIQISKGHGRTQSSAFLSTKREQHIRESKTPGPGLYRVRGVSEAKQSGFVEFSKQKTNRFQIREELQHEDDFFESNTILFKNKYENQCVPDFSKILARDDAPYRGIFGHLPQDNTIKDLSILENNEKKINREIEYQIQLQKRFSKYNSQPKSYEFNIPLKKIERAEQIDFQWSSLLGKYGFKRQRGRIVKNKPQQLFI